MEPLNKDILPPKEEPTWEFEEIVSPVQPKRSFRLPMGLLVLALVVVLGGLVYIYKRETSWFRIRLVQAPSELLVNINNSGKPVVVDSTPLPSVVVVSPTPAPRISSISTNTPNVATETAKKIVTGTSLTQPTYVQYKNSTYAYTITLPKGLQVVSTDMDGNIQVDYVRGGKIIFKAVIAGAFGSSIEELASRLALSPEVSSVHGKNLGKHAGLGFLSHNAKSWAVLKNDTFFFLTDYTGQALDTFTLN